MPFAPQEITRDATPRWASKYGGTRPRVFILVGASVLLALAWLVLNPGARELLASPVLAPDEVLLETALTWSPSPVWIDARPLAEFDRSHLPGAHSLPIEEGVNFEERLFRLDQLGLFDGSRPVVVYCSSRSCQLSRDVAARLREAYPQLKVSVLFGGWKG